MSENLLIATWLYADQVGEESTYAQVGTHSSSSDFQDIYWRCVVVFFATSIRNNPGARHLFFTNRDRLPVVDDWDLSDFFLRHGIEVIRCPFTFAPPEGFFGAWRNQFYVFDLIKHLASIAGSRERCILLDSDCVWIHPADTLADAISKSGLLTYCLDYPEDRVINGLTRRDMEDLYLGLGFQYRGYPPFYYGGEIFAATGEAAASVAAEFGPLWRDMLVRHGLSEKHFNEEAHALSYIYDMLGYPAGTANPFIKRIWTGLPWQAHNAADVDKGLVIWHLPLEKKFGLHRLFEEIRRPDSSFWTTPIGKPFIELMGRFLHIPRRNTTQLVIDTLTLIKDKVRMSR